MPRKISAVIVVWLAIAAVGIVSFVSRVPACDVDPTAQLCDRAAAIAFGAPYLIGGIVWAVVLVMLLVAWFLSWIRAAQERAP